MYRKFLVKQVHQDQILPAIPTGLVVEAAAGQARGLTVGLHRAAGRGRGVDQGTLLSRVYRGSVSFSIPFSNFSRPCG